jgi:hypothetical protein
MAVSTPSRNNNNPSSRGAPAPQGYTPVDETTVIASQRVPKKYGTKKRRVGSGSTSSAASSGNVAAASAQRFVSANASILGVRYDDLPIDAEGEVIVPGPQRQALERARAIRNVDEYVELQSSGGAARSPGVEDNAKRVVTARKTTSDSGSASLGDSDFSSQTRKRNSRRVGAPSAAGQGTGPTAAAASGTSSKRRKGKEPVRDRIIDEERANRGRQIHTSESDVQRILYNATTEEDPDNTQTYVAPTVDRVTQRILSKLLDPRQSIVANVPANRAQRLRIQDNDASPIQMSKGNADPVWDIISMRTETDNSWRKGNAHFQDYSIMWGQTKQERAKHLLGVDTISNDLQVIPEGRVRPWNFPINGSKVRRDERDASGRIWVSLSEQNWRAFGPWFIIVHPTNHAYDVCSCPDFVRGAYVRFNFNHAMRRYAQHDTQTEMPYKCKHILAVRILLSHPANEIDLTATFSWDGWKRLTKRDIPELPDLTQYDQGLGTSLSQGSQGSQGRRSRRGSVGGSGGSQGTSIPPPQTPPGSPPRLYGLDRILGHVNGIGLNARDKRVRRTLISDFGGRIPTEDELLQLATSHRGPQEDDAEYNTRITRQYARYDGAPERLSPGALQNAEVRHLADTLLGPDSGGGASGSDLEINSQYGITSIEPYSRRGARSGQGYRERQENELIASLLPTPDVGDVSVVQGGLGLYDSLALGFPAPIDDYATRRQAMIQIEMATGASLSQATRTVDTLDLGGSSQAQEPGTFASSGSERHFFDSDADTPLEGPIRRRRRDSNP